MECQEAGIERAAQQAPPLLGSSAGALVKARPGGGATKIAAGACRTAFELPLLGSLAQRSKRQDRGGATRRAASECAAALEGAPPGIEPGLPDPELTRAGLFGGHHVRKWWPAKHRRSQASKVRPGLDRTNACKQLATHSPGASWLGERSTPKGRASVFQMASERRRRVPWPEMSGLPVETAPKAAPLLPTHIRVPSRDALARLPQRSSVLAEPCAMNCRTMHRS